MDNELLISLFSEKGDERWMFLGEMVQYRLIVKACYHPTPPYIYDSYNKNGSSRKGIYRIGEKCFDLKK